jgi:hypothetical protein
MHDDTYTESVIGGGCDCKGNCETCQKIKALIDDSNARFRQVQAFLEKAVPARDIGEVQLEQAEMLGRVMQTVVRLNGETEALQGQMQILCGLLGLKAEGLVRN